MTILRDPYVDSDRWHFAVLVVIIIVVLLIYNIIAERFLKSRKLYIIKPPIIFLLAIVSSYIIVLASQSLPVGVTKVQAQAYTWPAGCERRAYRVFDSIERACGEEKYEIRNYRSYGLSNGAGRSAQDSYFRIDNDAVQIKCRDNLENDCIVSAVYRNVYYQ